MTRRASMALAAGFVAIMAGGPTQAADACDVLTARVIRATGASLAGRAGTGAVFRAADAERMSLACRAPRRIVLGSLAREPDRRFFALIGAAAHALTGARAEEVEGLALNLHQDSLLTGMPHEGIAGRAALRCETGPRADGLAGSLTVCLVTSVEPLRRRAGLFVNRPAG